MPAAARQSRALARLALPLVGAAAGVMMLSLALALNVWVDEAYTLHTTGHGALHAWRRALSFELQSPGYFVLLSLWRTLDPSPEFARLFSVLCALATLPVLAAVGRAYLGRRLHPGFLVLPLAFHPLVVYGALEIRRAALCLLLSALLCLYFHRGFLQPAGQTRARLLYTLLALAALYTQYYLGFLLAAGGVVLVAQRRWPEVRGYALCMAVAALGFAPLALIVMSQVAGYGHVLAEQDPGGPMQMAYWRLAEYVLPVSLEALNPLRGWTIRVLLVLLGVAAVVRHRRLAAAGAWPPVGLAAVTSLCFVLVLAAMGHNMMEYRHTLFLFLPLMLALFALALAALGPRAVVALSLLMLLFNGLALAVRYGPMAKNGDWQRVASYLSGRARPGEPVLVFQGACVLPLRMHYRGPNQLIPLPREPRLDRWRIDADALRSPAELTRALARVKGRPHRYWLVSHVPPPGAGVQYNARLLDRYVQRRFVVLDSRSFYQSKVTLLRLRRPRESGRGVVVRP